MFQLAKTSGNDEEREILSNMREYNSLYCDAASRARARGYIQIYALQLHHNERELCNKNSAPIYRGSFARANMCSKQG